MPWDFWAGRVVYFSSQSLVSRFSSPFLRYVLHVACGLSWGHHLLYKWQQSFSTTSRSADPIPTLYLNCSSETWRQAQLTKPPREMRASEFCLLPSNLALLMALLSCRLWGTAASDASCPPESWTQLGLGVGVVLPECLRVSKGTVLCGASVAHMSSLDALLLYTCANSEGASRAYMCYRSHPHCWSSLYCLCSFCIQRRMWESGFL